MASFLSQISICIISIFLLFTSPSCSTPRRLLSLKNTTQTGFRISLDRVDSAKNLTKFERVQHGIKRGQIRLEKFNTLILSKYSKTGLKSPVYPGNGEFLMKLAIGTPPKPFSAIMDTGSDLIWTQCKHCKKCFSQPTPIFDPKKSSSYSKLACSSNLCKALPTPTCGKGCEYDYSYGDKSYTQGVMATETFTFQSGTVSKIGFGCGLVNEGGGFGQGAGLVGLGRGPLSLVSQLKVPKFSYCLTSIDDNKSSTLLLGSLVNFHSSSSSKVKTTPLVKSPFMPTFYYITLEGITVGGTRLPIKKSTFAINGDGSGGLIMDSGTTITYLENSAFDLVKKEFIKKTKLKVDHSRYTELDLCFKLPKNKRNMKVPSLVFHFLGADLVLPRENYIITDSATGLMCLAMGGSSGISIFGNIQQQNMMVVHDIGKGTLSFVPTQCDKF